MDELRRGYHDRIAALRAGTVAMVGDAASSVENVTAALLERDPDAGQLVVVGAVEAAARMASVEREVVELLAQQAPVARDLRTILASLRIAQVAELCLGLSRTLARRVGRSDDVMTPVLRALAYGIGAATVGLLERAKGAWVALDEDQARAVLEEAEECRSLQRRFLAELFELSAVPVDAAVDLGMAARAYERLTDHAVEIAGRVVFAVTGMAAAPPN